MFKFGSMPLLIIPVVLYNILAFFLMQAAPAIDPSATPATPPATSQTTTDGPVTLASPTAGGGQMAGSAETSTPAVADTIMASETAAAKVTQTRFVLGLPTGGEWHISAGDLLLMLALSLLFLELIKSTSASSSAIANHAFSLILFVVCLVEFLLLPAFATSVFFLVLLMCLLDVLAGIVVTIMAARRDISLAEAGLH